MVKRPLKAQIAFIGVELYLFYRGYVNVKEKIKGFPLFLYQIFGYRSSFFPSFLHFSYFTLTGLQSIPEPLLYILKSQEVTFVERLDLFFLYIWMIWSIITVTIFSFSALFVHRLHTKAAYVKGIQLFGMYYLLLFLYSFYQNIEYEILNDVIIYLHLIFSIIIPTIVIIANRRKRK